MDASHLFYAAGLLRSDALLLLVALLLFVGAVCLGCLWAMLIFYFAEISDRRDERTPS